MRSPSRLIELLGINMILRCFSKLPAILSPLGKYMERISEVNLSSEISKRAKKDLPLIKEQISVLKDIEQASIFRMKDLPNDTIISLIKAYTMLEQGSHYLYANLTQEINKRINSFTIEELATIAYFLSSIRQTGRLFDVIKDLVMKDPLQIPSNSIGKLAFSFAVQEKYCEDLFKVLNNIFIVAKDDLNLDTGLLFLTGIYKVKHVNPLVLENVEFYVEKFWNAFTGEETAHIIFILHKFGLEVLAEKKIKEIDLEKLKGSDINKIIGCYIAKNIEPPQQVLDRLEVLIDEMKISASEMFELIYSLNSLGQNEKFFIKIEEALEKMMLTLSNKEKLTIFLAFLNTKRENVRIMERFSTEFHGGFEAEDLIMLFPCFVKRDSLFLPYTQKILDIVLDKIKGKDIKTQEALVVMYCMCKVKYADEEFLRACIEFVRYCRITSAEEYVQVKKTVSEMGKLGVDVEGCLSELVRKYERE